MLRFSFLTLLTFATLLTACGDPPCPTGTTRNAGGRCTATSDAGDAGASDSAASDSAASDSAAADSGADSAVRDSAIRDSTVGDSGPGDTGTPDACMPSGVDLPDPEFIDLDCDGLDGELATSVFVATSGDDANEGTTAAEAVRTLGRGVAVAVALGRPSVLVGGGNYTEQLDLVDGVSLYGGYDVDAGWVRTGVATTLRGPTPVIDGADLTDVTLAAFNVVAEPSAMGASNFAMHIVRSDGVTLRGMNVTGAAAGDGMDGAPVTTVAPDGRVGTAGGQTVLSGSGCPGAISSAPPALGIGATVGGSCSCAAGGTGGRGGFFRYSSDGFVTRAGAGAPAGLAERTNYLGRPACPAYLGPTGGTVEATNGGTGTSASDGAAGSQGARGAAVGAFTSAGYAPARGGIGREGDGGHGGGGGGGATGCLSGSCYVSGGAGGGGGSGACGGDGGNGGDGGGASVALFLWNAAVTLEASTLTPGEGGQGGVGSDGRPGGTGGSGRLGGTVGSRPCFPGFGGTGGNGGDGGDGGSGAGGGGGPAIGVMLGGTSTVTPDGASTINGGTGGAGGAGGTGAPAGATGTSAGTYP